MEIRNRFLHRALPTNWVQPVAKELRMAPRRFAVTSNDLGCRYKYYLTSVCTDVPSGKNADVACVS
jgi:hypothetical protein